MNEPPSFEFSLNRRTIASNIATLFTGSAIAQLLTAATFILMARQVGPDQYGQYSGSMVLATFCSIVYSLGLNLWLLHEGGRTPQKIGRYTGSVIFIKLAIGVFWLVVMYFVAAIVDSTALPSGFVRLAAVIIWLNSMFTTALTGFKAILRNKVSSTMEVVSTGTIFVITLALIGAGINDVYTFMQSRALVYLVSLLGSLLITWKIIALIADRRTSQQALRQSPPYAASEFLSWTYTRADVLIIALMLNETAVGLYSPAVGLINAIYLIPMTIHMVMIPVLSNLFKIKISQAWITSRRMMYVLALIGLSLFAAVYFGAKYLVLLLGSAFSGSQDVLQILSLILLIHSLLFGVAAILVATNQQGKRSLVQAIAVVINITLNFLIIQRWGIEGVAWVFVITEIVLLLGYSWLVIRYWNQSKGLSRGVMGGTA